MKFQLPPPLTEAPPSRPPWEDFKLLLGAQRKVTWNKIRHWPKVSLIVIVLSSLGGLSLLVSLGVLAYGALANVPPEIGRGLLALIFMAGFAALIFFGVTSAFASLYMSNDLELLFMAPVPTRIVFATKLLAATGANFFTAALFIFLPSLFYGLLLKAEPLFYLWAVLVGLGLWATGTALAGLLNLLVMRIVPPHRSKEAVGVLGATAGIIIALLFQIPNLVMAGGKQFDLQGLLSGQQPLLRVMDYLPWGWGSLALAGGASGNHLAGLCWSLLLLLPGTGFFLFSFLLVERGFRRGWISLSQGEERKLKRRASRTKIAVKTTTPLKTAVFTPGSPLPAAPPRLGMWAVAKKDLLYLRRDTREWFGLITPLILMAYFIVQFRLLPGDSSLTTLVTVLIMYSIIFSGNLALQSFGREGESDWILNSVPLAGWPVAWGKLLAVILPTLILMEALLAGTALATGLSLPAILALAFGALFVTFSASAIGLFFSIRHCRYNPDSPRGRIASGAAWLMYLLNIFFMALIALGLLYLFPPLEITSLLQEMPSSFVTGGGLPGLLLKLLYLLSRPLLWPAVPRIFTGLLVSGGVWTAVFFGFMAATVRQSRKGFRVEILMTGKKLKLR